MADGKIPDEFEVGEPVLVCRWRLAKRALPAANRHMRALGARTVNGGPLSKQLLGWAKQHIEWTLAEGSADYPNGVLMLLVDAEGRAAMAAGAYEPLADVSAAGLAARAVEAAREAEATGVAPETLWAAGKDGSLVCGTADGQAPSGVSSLVLDLAAAWGLPVSYDEGLAERVATGEAPEGAALFLASDEHGVVCAADASGEQATRFADAYAKLLA